MEPAIFKALADGRAPQFPLKARVYPQLRKTRSLCCNRVPEKRPTADVLVRDLKRLKRKSPSFPAGYCGIDDTDASDTPDA